MLKVEFIEKKHFFVGKSFLPVFDWDTPDGGHPSQCITLLSRDEVIPYIEAFCVKYPELGFWIEKTPGGVRGFLNKPVTKEEWKKYSEELKCDPLFSEHSNPECTTWDTRVSPKQGCMWSTKMWFYCGKKPSQESIHCYEEYWETVRHYNTQMCRQVFVRKNIQIKKAEDLGGDLVWAQIDSYVLPQYEYGIYKHKITFSKEINLCEGEDFVMGNHAKCPKLPGYTFGTNKFIGMNKKDTIWISFHKDLISHIKYEGIDNEQIKYSQAKEKKEQWKKIKAFWTQSLSPTVVYTTVAIIGIAVAGIGYGLTNQLIDSPTASVVQNNK